LAVFLSRQFDQREKAGSIESQRSAPSGEFSENVVERFASQGHELLDRAERSLEEGNDRAATHAVHALTGQSATFGCELLRRACQRFYRSLQQDSVRPNDLIHLRQVFDTTCQALTEEALATTEG